MVVETARRQEIEDAASALFHLHGYSGTSVRDIARAVDIQGASLYAHVTSKQDVLWSIVEHTAARFDEAADAIDADPEMATLDDPAHLAALVRGHVRVVTDDVERASVFIHEWRALQGHRREEIVRRRDAYEARFRSVVADGIRTGAFQLVDPALATAYLLTALNGLVGWYRPDGRLSGPAIADAYAELSLRAVTAPLPPA